MSMELLKSIEQAETKAEGIRADAQKEARDILKVVEEVTVQNERAAALDHRALAQRVLEDARATATRRIEAMAAQEQASREAVEDAARAKLDKAAALIYERVVSDGHR